MGPPSPGGAKGGRGPAGSQVNLRIVELLQSHITPALRHAVFGRVCRAERQPVWTLLGPGPVAAPHSVARRDPLWVADQCAGSHPVAADEALALYRFRWSVERMYADSETALNLNRLYAANPNAVAMQVYAAELVYNAMWVAQSDAAGKVGVAPEEIAPAKFFPGWPWPATSTLWSNGGARSPSAPSKGAFPPGPASPPMGLRVAGAESRRTSH
jgi:hypothetical protein